MVAIAAEFLRGANVVRTQTGKSLTAAVWTLTMRNNRRYGGYIVHFGIVIIATLGGDAGQQYFAAPSRPRISSSRSIPSRHRSR